MIAKRIGFVGAMLACTIAAVTVGSTASGAPRAITAKALCIKAPKKTIAVVDVAHSSPMDAKMDEIIFAAAKKLGWKVIYTDTNASPTKAQAAVQAAVLKKADLIITLSIDQAPIRQGLLAARAAKIPVIITGGGSKPVDLYTAAYTEDEYRLGYTMGQNIAKYVPNAKIANLYTTFDWGAGQRNAGLIAGIKATNGQAEIIASENVNVADMATSTSKLLTDMITRFPETNAAVAIFDNMMVPAAAAIRALNKDVKLFTYFGTSVDIANLKNGNVAGLVDSNLPLTPIIAIDQYLNHERTGAKYDPKAIQKAGGLNYRWITDKNTTPISNAATLAPFLKKWAKAYPC